MTPRTLSFSAGPIGKLSRDGITNASLLASGEAKGHGMMVDLNSLRGAESLLTNKPLRAFLTHANAAGDRLGEEIGFFEGAYIDGEKLRAKSFRWLESFKQHRTAEFEKLLELGELSPDSFGISLVFRAVTSWALPSGDEVPGSEPRPEGALFPFPSVRFVDIESADFVSSPAANSGLFTTKPAPAPSPSFIPDPAPSAFASQLAAKHYEIQTLSARIVTLEAQLKDAKAYDMRKAGVTIARDFNPDPVYGHVIAPGLAATDAQKWEHYGRLKAINADAAEAYRVANLTVRKAA